MAWAEFNEYRGGFKVGQRVRVYAYGGVGVNDGLRYDTLVRVTDTLVTTESGFRFNKFTGVEKGAKARCERRSYIARVQAEA